MAKVKICGLTNVEDARKAEELGADYLGFVFFDKSLRVITLPACERIVDGLKGSSKKVGLFLDQPIAEVARIARAAGLDALQLHGDEGPEYINEMIKVFRKRIIIIKSFKIKKGFDFSVLDKYPMVDFILFDTFKEGMPGGTGIAFDWDIVSGRTFQKPLFLAGGLNPGNVREAVRKVNPYAVDIASGVESSPGKKDHALMEGFINAAR